MEEKQKKKRLKPLEGDARIDRFTLITITIIDIFLFAGYVLDFMEGNLHFHYWIAFQGIVLGTLILDMIIYKVKPKAFRYISVMGYVFVYAMAVFGAKNDLTFAIAFPIIIMYILYYDYKLIATICGVFGAVALIDCGAVVMRHATHSGGEFKLTTVLLEGICIVFFLVVLGEVTVMSIQNNDKKINKIKSMADRVNESIHNINGQLSQLNESSVSTKSAMEEVNSGVTDTAEAVQVQLMQTEEIQGQIESIQNAAKAIYGSVNETMNSVSEGNKEVADLVEQAETSVGISADVVEKLEVVKNNMEEMNSITQLIDSIAFQTNIMALNANVEAARAGEAGRGFAVVASEISNMSAKTKDATDSIAGLIGNVSDSIEELVAAIDEMTQVIKAEEVKTNKTSEIFAAIESNTQEVSENADNLLRNMITLTDANKEIVESVQTISAASEQVTALTNQALDTELENADVIDDVANQMRALAESTEES